MPSQPSWLRRTAQREQYLHASIARTASVSRQDSTASKTGVASYEVAPHPQPHFILDRPTPALATQLSSNPHTHNPATTIPRFSVTTISDDTLSRSSQHLLSSSFDEINFDRLSNSDSSGLTFSTDSGDAASWITCSSATCDSTGAVIRDSMLSPSSIFTANITAQNSPARKSSRNTTNEANPNKPKGAGGMLSAWNRKKNRNLPRADQSNVGSLVARSNSTSPSLVNSPRSQLTSLGGSSSTNSIRSPQLASSASARESTELAESRPKPRSGKPEESENIGELCDFLNERRIQPNDPVNTTVEPRSTFDWDSDDEGKGIKTNKLKNFPRLKKRTKTAAAMGRSEAEAFEIDEGAEDVGKVARKLGMMYSPDSPAGSRANAFQEQPDLLNVAAPRRELPVSKARATHVNPRTAQTFGFSRDAATKRSSVLKLFNDPIWGGDSVTGYNFRETEFSNLTLGRDAYNRAKKKKQNRLSTSASMPSLTSSPKRKVGQTTLDDLDISPNGYRHSKCEVLEATHSSAHDVTMASPPELDELSNEDRGMPSGPKKIKSPPVMTIPPRDFCKHVEHTVSSPGFHTSSPGLAEGGHTPKTPSRLRHGTGASEVSGPRYADPFSDSNALSPAPPRSSASGESSTIPGNAGSLEMSRTTSGSSILAMTPSPSTVSFEPSLPVTPSQKPKKLEKVRKPETEEAKFERLRAETNRRSESRLTSLRLPALEQKRLNRIKAGKDVIQSGSQLGVMPKKSIAAITEEEFEAVGIGATTSQKETSTAKKSKILGSFFKKSRNVVKDDGSQGSDVRQQLDEHDALQVLNEVLGDDIASPTMEECAHFEDALKLANANEKDVVANVPASQVATTTIGLGIQCGHGDDIIEQTVVMPQVYELAADPAPYAIDILRTMSTIDEASTEHSLAGHDFDNEDAESASVYSVDDVEDERSPKPRHEADDASSAFTCEDAMPEPLKIQKRRLPPLEIPVLKVARNPEYDDLENSPSFSPRRNSSFMRKIQEASLARQRKLESHPAMREISPEVGDSSRGSDETQSSCFPTPKRARSDSGVAMSMNEFHDEGYGTSSTRQSEFTAQRSSKDTLVGSPTSYSLDQRTSSSSGSTIDHNKSRLSGKIDMQKLRNDVDLQPLQLPMGDDSPRHPHHPLTWDHEKVMCRIIHNNRNVQPQLPEVPKNYPVNLRHVNSVYFDKSDPMDTDTENVQKCSICSKLCCKYADLLIASKSTSQDLGETAMRLKARNRVSLLRSAHPNGIEEYETFVECGLCGRKICPGCSSRCMDELCKDVYCVECGQGAEKCPIHNFF